VKRGVTILAELEPKCSPGASEDAPRTEVYLNVVAEDDYDDEDLKPSEYHSHCVSVMGATHAGKSFLINALTGSELPIARSGGDAPTSSGAKQLMTELSDAGVVLQQAPKPVLVRFVDYEGAKGSNLLPTDAQEKMWRVRRDESRVSLFELRRKATGVHLPRMAYMTSDVLVYVTTLSPADYRTIEECAEVIANSAYNTAREAPTLILVFNKYEIEDDERDDETFTRGFLDMHDSERCLSRLFQDVLCVRLPRKKSHLYRRQLAYAKNTLARALIRRTVLRQKRGTLFGTHVWLPLYRDMSKEVLDGSDELRMVSMSEILLQAVFRVTPLEGTGDSPFVGVGAIQLYRTCAYYAPVTSMETFEAHCTTVLRAVAIVLARRTFTVASNLGTDGRLSEAAQKFMLEQYDETAAALTEKLGHYFEPCGATTEAHDVVDIQDGTELSCTLSSFDHNEMHYSAGHEQRVQSSGIFKNAWQKLKAWAGIKKVSLLPVSWPGCFKPPQPHHEGKSKCLARATESGRELLKYFLKLDTSVEITTLIWYAIANLRSAVNIYSIAPGGSTKLPACAICLGATDTERSFAMRCGHSICTGCKPYLDGHRYTLVELEDGGPVDTRAMQDYTGGCPYCGHALTVY
jgi:hypothetical protein